MEPSCCQVPSHVAVQKSCGEDPGLPTCSFSVSPGYRLQTAPALSQRWLAGAPHACVSFQGFLLLLGWELLPVGEE